MSTTGSDDADARFTVALYEVSRSDRDRLSDGMAAALPGATLQFTSAPLLPGHVVTETEPALLGPTRILSVFINSRVTEDVLASFPALQCVATRSTGYDHIDLVACAACGITVCNVPHYGENTVAEHTFALILSLSRNIHKAVMRTTAGNFSLEGLQGFDLKGKTLGVVGAGSIGLHVIRIARAFGMRVIAYDVMQNALLAEVLGFEYAPLETLLRESDVVTLHAPALPSTVHLINRERLGMMKRGALLINTARGALVDTDALLWALDEGILAGAGLDVLEGEELISEERELLASEGRPASEEQLRTLLRNNLLLRRPNVVVTPHIGFDSREALQRILDTTVANIAAFVAGEPRNVVRR
jgi:D-lactate dehydrogenase